LAAGQGSTAGIMSTNQQKTIGLLHRQKMPDGQQLKEALVGAASKNISSTGTALN
jgi:hypothetical protein